MSDADRPDAGAGSHSTDVRTSVVIPAYDEVDNVGPLVEELLSTLDGDEAAAFGPYEVLLVDDGSTDGTRERLATLASEHPRVGAVLLRRNFGQAPATAAGVDHAAGDRIVTMDADRQNDPADVARLLAELEDGYDCVKGWRRDREDGVRKTIPSAIQTRLAWLTGPRIHDFVCGIAAYRTEAIRDVPLYGENHRYVPAMLHGLGYRVTELPVNHRPRAAGRTKYGPRRLVRGAADLWFHAYWNRFGERPIHAFGGALAVLAAVVALVAGYAALIVAGPLSPPSAALALPAAVVGAVLAVASVLATGGIVAESATRRHYRDARPYRVERVIDGDDAGARPVDGRSTGAGTRRRDADG